MDDDTQTDGGEGIARRLRVRWPFVLVAAVVAVVVGLLSIYHVGSSGLVKKGSVSFAGKAALLVDSNPSSLAQLNSATSATTLAGRAPLYAEYATNARIVAQIARRAGVSPASLSVVAATNQKKAPRYSNAGTGVITSPNTVSLQANSSAPIVTVNTAARSLGTARRLAAATVAVLQGSISRLQLGDQRALFRLQLAEQRALLRQQNAGKAARRAASGQTPAHRTTTSPTGTATTTVTTTVTTTTTTATAPASSGAPAAGSGPTVKRVVAIVLRPLGGVTAGEVRTTPTKTKALEYAVVAFVVLLLLILAADSVVISRRRRRHSDAERSDGASADTVEVRSSRA